MSNDESTHKVNPESLSSVPMGELTALLMLCAKDVFDGLHVINELERAGLPHDVSYLRNAYLTTINMCMIQNEIICRLTSES